MAYLEYGATANNRYIHISQVTSGQHNELSCPYCGVSLIARKGRKLVHHFAHNGETCRDVGDIPEDVFSIPYYDKFDLGLTPNDVMTLNWLAGRGSVPEPMSQQQWRNLESEGFVKWNKWAGRNGRWELTDRGKIIPGETTLTKFADIQYEQIRQKHEALVKTVQQAYEPDQSWVDPQPEYVPRALTTLNIYRSQLRRLLTATLYFFEIKHDDGKLYKIGVTTRDVDSRVLEVMRDVALFVDNPTVKVLRTCAHQGSIEQYFKHRYASHQVEMGTLTEYFAFESRRSVLSDLTRLGDRELHFTDANISTWEYRLIQGEPSGIERYITKKEYRKKHRRATIEGMEKAREQGVHVGRPPENDQTFLDKYPEVVTMLQQGESLRATAKKCGVSRNTVIKVKKILSD